MHREQGATIVELIIGLSLTAVVVVGFVRAFETNRQLNGGVEGLIFQNQINLLVVSIVNNEKRLSYSKYKNKLFEACFNESSASCKRFNGYKPMKLYALDPYTDQSAEITGRYSKNGIRCVNSIKGNCLYDLTAKFKPIYARPPSELRMGMEIISELKLKGKTIHRSRDLFIRKQPQGTGDQGIICGITDVGQQKFLKSMVSGKKGCVALPNQTTEIVGFVTQTCPGDSIMTGFNETGSIVCQRIMQKKQ